MDNHHSQLQDLSKMDVYIGRAPGLQGELYRIKKKKGLGRVTTLYLHFDPSQDHPVDTVVDFFKRVLSITRQTTKIQLGTHEVMQMLGGGGIAKVQVAVVIQILQHLLRRRKRTLTSVRLFNIKLQGSWQEFQNFGSVVRRMQHVERFNLDKIMLLDAVPASRVPLDAAPGTWLEPIMQAVAVLPRLKHLRILGSSDFGLMSAMTGEAENMDSVVQSRTLQLICASDSLVSLCLIHFNLSDDNTVAMARSLESNRSLRELDIDGTLGSDSSQALVDLMKHNNCLEDLNICIRGPGEIDSSSVSALQQQKNQETLNAEDDVNLQLAEGVQKSTLVNFALFRGRISSKSQDAFRSMISQQYCLESLTLYTGDDGLNSELAQDSIINFHCKLNKMGRRRVITGIPTPKPWKGDSKAVSPGLSEDATPEQCLIDTLGRVSDNLSALYYFLMVNPCICDGALQKLQAMEQQGRTKKQPKKKRKSRALASESEASQPNKRTRLYRAAKYRGVSYI